MNNSKLLYDKLKEIEIYINHWYKDYLINPNSSSFATKIVRSREDYKKSLEKTPYFRFIQHGDDHYFISRILFMNQILYYSYFSAQQCIENYLKGFLKLNKVPFQNTHDLENLLNSCRKNAPQNTFLKSNLANAIIIKYNPFNQYARYPIHTTYPNAPFATVWPDDINFLDYFIYHMKKLTPIPINETDIVRDKQPSANLIKSKKMNKGLWDTFVYENLNF